MAYTTDLKEAAHFAGVPLWFMELFHEHNKQRGNVNCLEVCRLYIKKLDEEFRPQFEAMEKELFEKLKAAGIKEFRQSIIVDGEPINIHYRWNVYLCDHFLSVGRDNYWTSWQRMAFDIGFAPLCEALKKVVEQKIRDNNKRKGK